MLVPVKLLQPVEERVLRLCLQVLFRKTSPLDSNLVGITGYCKVGVGRCCISLIRFKDISVAVVGGYSNWSPLIIGLILLGALALVLRVDALDPSFIGLAPSRRRVDGLGTSGLHEFLHHDQSPARCGQERILVFVFLPPGDRVGLHDLFVRHCWQCKYGPGKSRLTMEEIDALAARASDTRASRDDYADRYGASQPSPHAYSNPKSRAVSSHGTPHGTRQVRKGFGRRGLA